MGDILNINEVDIESYKEKSFLLDTNVLLWTFYPNSISPNYYEKCSLYADFVYHLLENNYVVIAMYNFCEALFVIEKIMYNTYKEVNNSNIRLKNYRKIKEERQRVAEAIKLFYSQIKQFSSITILEQSLHMDTVNKFVDEFDEHLLDFFDYCLANLSDNKGISLITDDADFKSKSISSDIYTLNSRLYNHNS